MNQKCERDALESLDKVHSQNMAVSTGLAR